MQLTVENITLRRGERVLIKDLSFSLKGGESLRLLGPNGVGKTTALRAIAGFLNPESGEICLEAPDKNNEDASKQQAIHYIGHKNGFRASLSVLENLEFWQDFYASHPDPKAIAKQFALRQLLHIKAGYLSQGQQRRLALSRLAIAPRPLWLLDEPTVSLDHKSAELIAAIANAHVETGGMLIVTSHIDLAMTFTKKIELTPITTPIAEALI